MSSSHVPAAHPVHVDGVSVNDPAPQAVQLFVAVDNVEASALKVPEAHGVHSGCTVLDPARRGAEGAGSTRSALWLRSA